MIERYREWYTHERDCNEKMLAMVDSVPIAQRNEPRFATAVQLAAHLAACRENWLDRMRGSGTNQVDWWPEQTPAESLRPRYSLLESEWAAYLNGLSDSDLGKDFEFPDADGGRWRWNIEGQIIQLVGHAFYHRGQISLLVKDLGGQTVDTDYLYWAYQRDPRFGRIDSH